MVSVGSGANRRFGFESLSSVFFGLSLLLTVFVSMGSTANFRLGRAGLSSSLAESDLLVLVVVSMGSGANFRFGDVVFSCACSCLLLLVEVSIGCGANFRFGLVPFTCCDVPPHIFLSSTGPACLCPLVEASSVVISTSVSFKLSTCSAASFGFVEAGVGEEVRTAIDASVDSELSEGQGEASELSEGCLLLLREVISTGSAKNRRLGGVVDVMARVTSDTGRAGTSYSRGESRKQAHEEAVWFMQVIRGCGERGSVSEDVPEPEGVERIGDDAIENQRPRIAE